MGTPSEIFMRASSAENFVTDLFSNSLSSSGAGFDEDGVAMDGDDQLSSEESGGGHILRIVEGMLGVTVVTKVRRRDKPLNAVQQTFRPSTQLGALYSPRLTAHLEKTR